MIRLSSIFSFSTLRGSFRPTGAAVMAVALVVALELGVRLYAPRIQWSAGIPSFDLLVDHYRHRLANTRPDIWLMGNSTLERGVDEILLQSTTGHSIQPLPVGSGTLAGEIAMLEYFLRRTPAFPKRVVFCLTQDDLNDRGYRAEISKRYLEYDSWRGWTVDRFFRLDDVGEAWLDKMKALCFSPAALPGETAPSSIPFNGQLSNFASNHLENLARDFTFDSSAFPRLETLSREYGFRVTFCLMPVTDVYLQFHERLYPDLSSSAVVARIAVRCAGNGFDLHDYSQVALHQYEYFMDSYHLNTTGRAWFTPLIAEALDVHPL
jgi:hypothetical protein